MSEPFFLDPDRDAPDEATICQLWLRLDDGRRVQLARFSSTWIAAAVCRTLNAHSEDVCTAIKDIVPELWAPVTPKPHDGPIRLRVVGGAETKGEPECA